MDAPFCQFVEGFLGSKCDKYFSLIGQIEDRLEWRVRGLGPDQDLLNLEVRRFQCFFDRMNAIDDVRHRLTGDQGTRKSGSRMPDHQRIRETEEGNFEPNALMA
jgi:hypothetical protein